MNHAQAMRDLRKIEDHFERYYEYKVKRLQATFALDRDTAAAVLEFMEMKIATQTFSGFCGLFAGWYAHSKLSPLLQSRSLLFKKPWMRPVVPLVAVYLGYDIGFRLRMRRLAGRDPDFERMSGSTDLLARFREVHESKDFSAQESILEYVTTCTPATGSEIKRDLEKLTNAGLKKYEHKRIRRQGKDRDDIFWLMGKIHGLENIAFLTKEELNTIDGNPVKLQELVNNAQPTGAVACSFNDRRDQLKSALAAYKQEVDKMSLTRSDRSKMLALPFFCARRTQGPEPKKGQWQWDLFTELSGGKSWNHYDDLEYDPEHKVNFNEYQKFFPAGLVEKMDSNNEEFKKQIRLMTLLSKTEYEKWSSLKKNFRELMNVLPSDEKEGRAFVHLLRNKFGDNYIDEIHGRHVETRLAEVSEKENFAKKNYYRLNKRKLQYVEPERMPIEKAKVADLFRNSRDFKERFNKEMGLFNFFNANYDFDKRVIQYFYETCKGPMVELRKEIGLDDRWSTSFMRIKDFKELKDKAQENPVIDHGWTSSFSRLIFPIDMTDYDDHYIGPGELQNAELGQQREYYSDFKRMNIFNRKDPLSDPYALEEAEPPNFHRSSAMQEFKESLITDDDDDEGEGEEEQILTVEDPMFENEDYAEEEEEPDWPVEQPKYVPEFSRPNAFFNESESIRDKFDEIELDNFMKLLDCQPFRNWKDNSMWQNRLGFHDTEDHAQKIDPEYHMYGEVEREEFEKMIFRKHRSGSTVRFVLGQKKPRFHNDVLY
jgi:hypothetical protein